MNTIQENTEFNQRYDFGKEHAAEKGFTRGAVYTVASTVSKSPGRAIADGAILVGGNNLYNAKL